MISAIELTKKYGDRTAIENISFRAKEGDVVGFLGPNGAGKTTTMRLLSGCLSASAGRIEIDGKPFNRNTKNLRRLIGYLPEHPPLYESMTVRSYIQFAAKLRLVSRPLQACEQILGRVGLDEVVDGVPLAERIIGHLSKGYRQRVGIAQALVHDPQILILDEPTSGLDPAQRTEVLNLLMDLAQNRQRTIILSSHILSDIKRVCDRVVVLHQGQLIAEDAMASFQERYQRLRLEVEQGGSHLRGALLKIDGVLSAEETEPGQYRIEVSSDVRSQVSKTATPYGLLSLSRDERLKEPFLRLTRETR